MCRYISCVRCSFSSSLDSLSPLDLLRYGVLTEGVFKAREAFVRKHLAELDIAPHSRTSIARSDRRNVSRVRCGTRPHVVSMGNVISEDVSIVRPRTDTVGSDMTLALN